MDRSSGHLLVEDLAVYYGHVRAVEGISLFAGQGEIVALVGANGAGKSTLLAAIIGVTKPKRGRVLLEGREITDLGTSEIVRLGVQLVPEGRGVLAHMTVQENLLLGMTGAKKKTPALMESQFQRFPVLRERLHQMAGTLSGGEQQMLVIARALMGAPRLLLLDEPSLGLAPATASALFQELARLGSEGVTVIVSEQNARLALRIADRAYVLETGRLALEGDAGTLMGDERVKKAYVGC